jgi:hypothetical protein
LVSLIFWKYVGTFWICIFSNEKTKKEGSVEMNLDAVFGITYLATPKIANSKSADCKAREGSLSG